MKKYFMLAERVGDEGIYEREIILEMNNDVITESHITTPIHPDEDILKGKSSEDLDNFVKGDKDREWGVYELNEAQYQIEYKKNKIARMRLDEKNKDVDQLALKERELRQAERVRPRKGCQPKSKEQKRADAYKKILEKKYNRNL